MEDRERERELERVMVPSEPITLDVLEMSDEEMHSLLLSAPYGHLGCSQFDKPYVVPIHYVYAGPDIFIYTTRGMKTELVKQNAQVCLQVEEVRDARHWQSVIVTGYAEQVDGDTEQQQALNLLGPEGPDLAPAMARVHFGKLLRSSSEVIYKIRVHHMTGRKTK